MIPGYDSPLARESFERKLAAHPKRRHVRRLWLTLPASLTAVAAAAAIAVIVTITPGVPVSPAAAAVLDLAAAAAGRQEPVVLHPGEYLYTKTRFLDNEGWVVRSYKIYPEFAETDQSWLTARGAGKDILTVDPHVTFAHGSRAAWIAAGRPRLPFAHNPDKPFVSWYTAPKPGSGPLEPIDTGVPLDNLSHLPTDPATLAQLIEQRKTGLADVNADVEDPSTPAGTFYAAMVILTAQSVGGSPALRAALFQVMAQQPGVKLLGRTTTRSGRTGIGLMTPALVPNGTDIYKVIIDPQNGQILESDEYARAGQPAEQWTEYLSSAVVDKIGQLPQDEPGPTHSAAR